MTLASALSISAGAGCAQSPTQQGDDTQTDEQSISGVYDVFLADPSGGVYTAIGSVAGGWSIWSNISQGHAGPNTSVTAYPISGGNYAVFLTDPNGGVYTASGNAGTTWSGWSEVSSLLAQPNSGVTVLPYGFNDLFQLFAADKNGGVWTSSGNTAIGWTEWTTVAQGHAGVNTVPTAVQMSQVQYEALVSDPSGGPYAVVGWH